MPAWGRADPATYASLPLEAHAVLSGVPLHDVWQIELGPRDGGATIEDVRGLFSMERMRDLNPVVAFLFQLRGWLGRVFRLDEETSASTASHPDSRLPGLPERLRSVSKPPSGTPEGPFTLLYALEDEAVAEIINKTVHAFSVLALVPRDSGYRLYFAIYVQPLGVITPLYMALIDPFRRFLVYPALLKHVHTSWERDAAREPN